MIDNETLFKYKIINGNATITGLTGITNGREMLIIPDTINGYPVTVIDRLAFCDLIETKNIHLPYSLKKIGEKAFENCISLESVIIPENVEYIGKEAFAGCISLRSVTIENPDVCIEDSFFCFV